MKNCKYKNTLKYCEPFILFNIKNKILKDRLNNWLSQGKNNLVNIKMTLLK